VKQKSKDMQFEAIHAVLYDGDQ